MNQETSDVEAHGNGKGPDLQEKGAMRSGPAAIVALIRTILARTLDHFSNIGGAIEASYLDEYTGTLTSLSRCLSLFSIARQSPLDSYNPGIAQMEFTLLRTFFFDLDTERVYHKLQHLRHFQGADSIASIFNPQKGLGLFLRLFDELAEKHKKPIRIGSSKLGCHVFFFPDVLLKNIILDEDDGPAQLARLRSLLGISPIVRDPTMDFLETQPPGASATRIEEIITIVGRYDSGARITTRHLAR